MSTGDLAALRAAALRQPGAVERGSGVIKFQCPQCAAEGHDRHRDNAALFPDGRWGCAHTSSRAHWDAIRDALGVRTTDHAPPPPSHEPVMPPAAGLLQVPGSALIGLGREFADLYAAHLESPVSFFFFTFLTYFGALVAHMITLASALRPQPRMYTVLIGESADTRKSTALRMADEFFRQLWTGEPRVLYGVGSAEGLAAELKDSPNLLLHFDELKGFVDKAKNEHSVALPMVSTLFERGEYDNRTKDGRLSVRDAALSLVAACTADTYATMFDQRFLFIGFPNRLWLVADRSTTSIAVPTMVPPERVAALQARTRTALEHIADAYRANALQPVAYPLTPQAHAIFEAWYASRGGSIFGRRLDTYGHRLMLLLAATTGRQVIDEEVANCVVALLRYQLDVRRETDPVDAENSVAKTEERIRRALARGPLPRRDLMRRVHAERVGLWIWNTAVDNLKREQEVAHDPKADRFWLV